MSRSAERIPDPARRRLSTNEKIDVCRGVFAFLVVVAHGLEVTYSMLPIALDRLDSSVRQVLVGAAGTGIYWVMGFFVISGYCIQLSVQRLGETGGFTLRTYLIARLTRILPLYYLALLFTALVEWWIASDRPGNWPNGLSYQVFACQLLLIQNLTETYGSFASSWSITNEAFYYLLYGLLVVWTLRRGRRPVPLGMAACLGVGGLAHLSYRLGLRSSAIVSTATLFGLGTLWFLGALIAAHRDRVARDARLQVLARTWPLILAASVALRCTDRVGIEFVLMGSGLAFTLMLIRFLGADRERGGRVEAASLGPRTRTIVAGLGLASYPTYLFHGPVMMAVGSTMIRTAFMLDWRWTWVVLASSGTASGIVGGYLVEAPIMTWRAGLLRRLKSTAETGGIGGQVKLPVAATQ
jgi:peptidoglycan/LPS O-acetylase OafA/YrhL